MRLNLQFSAERRCSTCTLCTATLICTCCMWGLWMHPGSSFTHHSPRENRRVFISTDLIWNGSGDVCLSLADFSHTGCLWRAAFGGYEWRRDILHIWKQAKRRSADLSSWYASAGFPQLWWKFIEFNKLLKCFVTARVFVGGAVV